MDTHRFKTVDRASKMQNVPREEIETRLDKLQEYLQDQGFTSAFIMQNVDIFYFTGTIQTSVLFVPAEGEPILMVQKSLERARRESPIEKVVPIKNIHHFPQVLSDLGIDPKGKTGLEMDVLPANIYLWIKDTFSSCHMSDISGSIRRIRMIKSDYEQEQIKKASAILYKGFSEISSFLREGMTELEIDGYLGYIARKEGHMGYMRMRGWNQEMTYVHVLSGRSGAVPSFLNSPQGGEGTTPAMAQGAGYKRIRRDEPIEIDYGAAFNGYISDQSRTFVIGRLPEDMERAHDCSRDILDLLAVEARPGVSCASLYAMAVDRASEYGFQDNFMGQGDSKARFVGHGVGLEIDDFPILAPNFREELQEGMVIAIEPKFVFPGRGIVGLEDVYLVTPSGLKRLTLMEQQVVTL